MSIGLRLVSLEKGRGFLVPSGNSILYTGIVKSILKYLSLIGKTHLQSLVKNPIKSADKIENVQTEKYFLRATVKLVTV